jgi:photosystem II stability/assembly factor-like uncharacterized protein
MKKIQFYAFIYCLTLIAPLALQAQKDKKAEPEKPKHFLDTLNIGLRWRSIGPALTSGRVIDFAVDPQNRSTYYVAAAAGGVWKTENAGSTYQPIFESQGSYSIGCITIDPSNSNIVWVGSGENNNQRSVGYGDGVYRSLDGGKSWDNMGLKNSEHIGRIIVHPTNSDIVYVAAIGPLWSDGGDRGVYKTEDGGKTWNLVLKLDDYTGVNDIALDPRDPNVLYASAFQRRRHVFTYVGGGPGSTIYKTRDGGKTWNKSANGLPSVDIGRIGLGISPANPEIIYAIVEAAQGEGGFFKSTDRGASWEKQSGHATAGNYYCEIVPHPTDPNTVYSLDTYMAVSHDGGKSFAPVGEQWKHVDNHALWIDPKDPNYILNGCDGGIYESFNNGKDWVFKSNLSITQFYRVAVDNAEPFYNIYGGTQDNFSLGGPSRTRNQHGIVNNDWFITNGGDGFESQVDPQNPNIVYAQSQNGGLVRYDRVSGEITGIQPKPREGENGYRWNWDSPLAISQHKNTRLYFCSNKVIRTDDRGDSWEVISPDLTRQIDRNTLPVMGRIQSIEAVAKNSSTSEYGNIVAFAESPLNANLLYVGTDDGLVQITEDGGKTWTKIAAFPGVPDLTFVNFLVASRHNENVVYACFNNHKRGDFKPYVFKSSDKGRTWTNISANLPERGTTYCIAEDHVKSDLLFVGTEFSCFATVDGGKYWKKFAAGLPTICIRDMAIQPRENDLVLATFGRGFYVLDDYSPLRQINEKSVSTPAQIFPIKDGLAYIEAMPWGLRGKAFQGASFFTAPNPPVGATFTYYYQNEVKSKKDLRREQEKKAIKDGVAIRYPTYEELAAERAEEGASLYFTIRDEAGTIVRKLQTKPSKGISRIVWDGHLPTKTPINLNPGPEDIFGGLDLGPLAAPGNYTVSLSQIVNGQVTELVAAQPFKLNSLGGVTLAASDRKALEVFQKEAAELQRRFSAAESTLAELKERIPYMRKALAAIPTAPAELSADIKALEQRAAELTKLFYGDGVAAAIDKERQTSLSERVYSVIGDTWGSTSAPGNAQRNAVKIAGAALDRVLPQVKQLFEKDLKAVEQKLEAAGAPYTPGRGIGN